MDDRAAIDDGDVNDPQQTSDVQCDRCPVAEWLAYAD